MMMRTRSLRIDAWPAHVLRLALALSLLLLAACGGGYSSPSGSMAGMNQGMPVIMTQPADQASSVGGMATFTVAATVQNTGYGTGGLSYQWYQVAPSQTAGAKISAATMSSYTTAPVMSTDTGSKFYVTVTNAYGMATSRSALLTVM